MHTKLHTLKIDCWAILSWIPADDRDIWIAIGMALKAEFSDAGFSLYDEWSNSAENYNSKAVRDVWRSFKGNARGIGTLVYLAKQNDWRPGSESEQRPIPAAQKPPKEASQTSTYAKKLFLSSCRQDSVVSSNPYARIFQRCQSIAFRDFCIKKSGLTVSGYGWSKKGSGQFINTKWRAQIFTFTTELSAELPGDYNMLLAE